MTSAISFRKAALVGVAFVLSCVLVFGLEGESASANQFVAKPTTATELRSAHGLAQVVQTKKKRKRVHPANPDNLPQPMVSIVQGSTINLLSRSSKIPIAIRNGYDSPARLRVVVQPSNLKVLIPSAVEVLVPANTTITAKVPVTAIADGDVVLKATLQSFSGIRLTLPVSIRMNVILGVEDTVIYGFLAFVAGLGVLGAFRTIRKRRRTQAAEGQSS